MLPQLKLMYTETPDFGKNKRTQKITKNTEKYTLELVSHNFTALHGFFGRESQERMIPFA